MHNLQLGEYYGGKSAQTPSGITAQICSWGSHMVPGEVLAPTVVIAATYAASATAAFVPPTKAVPRSRCTSCPHLSHTTLHKPPLAEGGLTSRSGISWASAATMHLLGLKCRLGFLLLLLLSFSRLILWYVATQPYNCPAMWTVMHPHCTDNRLANCRCYFHGWKVAIWPHTGE